MNSCRIRQLAAVYARPLLSSLVVLALSGCGRQSDLPAPPHSPPRPKTHALQLISAVPGLAAPTPGAAGQPV